MLTAALCLLAAASNAATVHKHPRESAADFAARVRPNDAAQVVHLASARVWQLATPVIVAFYEYPVALADPGKNYGDAPDETEVLGVL